MVDAVVFPKDISAGSRGGPRYSTLIVESGSGAEQRVQRWERSRGRWNVGYGVRTAEQLEALQTFFHCRAGMARGFLFFDHRDHLLVNELVGVGDGATRAFQVVRRYGDAGAARTRRITRVEPSGFAVTVGGAAVASGWTLAAATGVVTFAAAPATGAEVRVSGSFYVPVRFASDAMEVTLDGVIGGWEEIVLEEILE